MTQTQSPAFYPETFTARAAAGITSAEAARMVGVKSAMMKKWEAGAEQAPQSVLDQLRAISPSRPKRQPDFTFIDLFAGIGGLRKAMESAGGDCIFTCEWNKMALETYLANFGDGHPVAGNIRDLDAQSDVPEHDVLVGGFPCQSFSLAGVSKKNSMGRPHGFQDETQGTLFFDVARIIASKRPKAFLLENVRNLASHDKGKTFEIILRTLQEELGYTVSWQVMEGTPWVPQRRPRIAIVGFRDGHKFDFSSVSAPASGPKLTEILHREGEEGSDSCPYAPGGRVLDKYTLTDGLWNYLQKHASKHAAKGNGFGFGLVGPEDVARTLSARYGKDGSEILIKQEGRNPRRLTPRECARLMGFDLPGFARTVIPVSDAQAYKQFGNSVVAPMFAAISRAMAQHVIPTPLAIAAE